MPLVHTPEPEIGSSCPDFQGPAVEGKDYSLQDFSNKKALVVMFICNHCPYVVAVEERIIKLAHSYKGQSVQFLGVCSNDAEKYPEDSFDNLKKSWSEKNYDFPYLFDEDQSMAKNFGAVCTPDFFVYDENRKLTYRGRLDDSWKEPEKVTRQELKEAIDLILQNEPPMIDQNASMGCSMKWKEQ